MKEYIIKVNVNGKLADECLNVLQSKELVRCKDCKWAWNINPTEEEKFYGEAIVDNSSSQSTTSYDYPQYGSENVRKKVLNMQEIEELLACLDSMLQ